MAVRDYGSNASAPVTIRHVKQALRPYVAVPCHTLCFARDMAPIYASVGMLYCLYLEQTLLVHKFLPQYFTRHEHTSHKAPAYSVDFPRDKLRRRRHNGSTDDKDYTA